MAREFIDGFESGSLGLWDTISSASIVANVLDGYSCKIENSSLSLAKIIPQRSEIYISWWFRFDSDGQEMFAIKNGSNTIFRLRRDIASIGDWIFADNPSNAVYGSSSVNNCTCHNNTIVKFGLYLKVHSTAGEIKLLMDGVTAIDLTNINTVYNGHTSFDAITFQGSSVSYLDNVVIDTSEIPIGTRIQGLIPSSDGTHSDLLGVDGLNNVAASYWRIRITQTGGSASCSIAELEFRGSAGGANLCSGGTPISSTPTGGYPASQAFDGNAATIWGSGDNPKWIGYQFASAVLVREYAIRFDPDTWQSEQPIAWVLEKSDDGVLWTAVRTITGQSFVYGEQKVFSAGDVAPFVNTRPPNDSKYISSINTNAQSTVNISNLTGDFFGVKSVQVQARSWVSGISPPPRAGVVIHSVDGEAVGAPVILVNTPKEYSRIWDKNETKVGNPDWTIADVNALEIGVKTLG